ncbi:hypothetical protein M5D96_011354 [Drosophila gunungcola]|uniref:Uncharacterized protein n=1 Tax=Drosophila gunungcola TaxID=103775 RepID=A0A9P9YFN1_9MUSC|nr:hypothetical protein M5D96_011354 [Drosophila gunungcola]
MAAHKADDKCPLSSASTPSDLCVCHCSSTRYFCVHLQWGMDNGLDNRPAGRQAGRQADSWTGWSPVPATLAYPTPMTLNPATEGALSPCDA